MAMLLQETVSKALETNRNVFVSYFDVSNAFDTVWTDGLFYKLSEMGISGRTWRILYKGYKDFRCKVRVDNKLSDWYAMSCGIHQGGFLSLMKYTAFINDLLVQLEHSNLCFFIGDIPSCPLGYADDLAAATISKSRTDKVHQLVAAYGNLWRFKFNARKSAVLIYDESKKSHLQNSAHRVFKLGAEKVPEKSSYDHVGIKAELFPEDGLRVNDKISKSRRTFNASSGLGIKKSGLNMIACNIIFWAVAIPTLTFGSECWILNDDDIDNLMIFQRHVGRRIQRLASRAHNVNCFYGLGWIRVTTYIIIKKILFILTILKLLNRVVEMSRDHRSIVGKKSWSNTVWEKARELDDCYWRMINTTHQENDIIRCTLPCTRYMSWWSLSDKFPSWIRICECMVRIIGHNSLLKVDDYHLRGLTMSHKVCEMCDLYMVESIQHIIMQCPGVYKARESMYNQIYENIPSLMNIFSEQPSKVLFWLLGRPVDDIAVPDAEMLLFISGYWIYSIYNKTLRNRSGIG